jgi:hypothetical protein
VVRDGEMVGFEITEKCVTPELAYVVEIERVKAKLAEGRISPHLLCGLR